MYYQAVKDKTNVMYIIQGERGGVVPEALQGRYTKKQFAEDAIKAYEAMKNDKVQTSSDDGSTRATRASNKKSSTRNRQAAS